MADFPPLVPTIRPLTPGQWGGATLPAMSGRVSTVRRSSAEIGRRLSLRFEAISEAQFLQIVSHYQGQRSGLDGFSFTTTTLPSAYTPSGHNWLYAGPPQVVDQHADVFTVELECRSEPRAIFRAPGVAFVRQPALTAGVVTAPISGAALAPTLSLAAGAATAIVGGATLQAGGAGDSDFSDVSVLLHFDGSNNSTTFTDSSSNAFTVTGYGDAKLTTTDPKFGSACLTLDGTGDYLTTPSNSKFQLGTGDFTVECWAYINSGNTNRGLFTFGTVSTGLALSIVSNNWRVTTAGSDGTVMGAVTTGVWQHFAITRNGTNLRMFVDGTQLGSTLTNSTNLGDNQLKIGYYYNTTYTISAKIDEFRVTKGKARYTANFAAPTAAFTDAAPPSMFAPGAPV